jgi:iron complex outermembrane receptor protein
MLQFNVAGFISDYKNMQQNTTIPAAPPATRRSPAMWAARHQGLEMDATLRPWTGLKLTASASLMESHFRNFVVGNIYNGAIVPFDYSNNRLIYAPKFSGSINAEYMAKTSFGSVVTTVGLRHIDPYDEQISLAG